MIETSKNSFVFYESFYNAINAIEDTNLKVKAYDIILKYGLYGEIPKTNEPILKVIFEMIKPLINDAYKKYLLSIENGKKGGAPKGNKNALKKQPEKQPEKQPKNNPKTRGCFQNNLNDNVNDNVNVNDNDNENENVNVNDNESENENVNNGGSPKPKLISLSQKDFETFKSKYPNKAITYDTLIPNYFDMNLLVNAIDESDFLKENNNLSFEWFVKNYDKVVNSNYKDYAKKDAGVIITHSYSDDYLNSIFTDIDSIDI